MLATERIVRPTTAERDISAGSPSVNARLERYHCAGCIPAYSTKT